jgi:hypothetical protein
MTAARKRNASEKYVTSPVLLPFVPKRPTRKLFLLSITDATQKNKNEINTINIDL